MERKQVTWTRKQWQDHRELVATVLAEVAGTHVELSKAAVTQGSPEEALRGLDMPEARLVMALELIRATRLRAAGFVREDHGDLVSRLKYPAAGEDWRSLRAEAVEMLERQATEIDTLHEQGAGLSP